MATVTEIKAAAWAEMAASDSADCSLRGVARRLGMAPSALYRYFASRDELLSAMIIDAFDDLTATLAEAREEAHRRVPADQPAEMFVLVAGRYRAWALQDAHRYRLIFGNPVGGYVGTDDTTAASVRSSQVLLELMSDLVGARALDVDRLETGLSVGAEDGFAAWGEQLPRPLPPVALALAIRCYAALHGAIQLEVNGHLPPPLRGLEDAFTDAMRAVVTSGLRPAAVG